MFFRLLRLLFRWALRQWIGRIQVDGLENFPAKGPFVIAANHPNSYLDALIIGTQLNRKFSITVRSDVFANPVANLILRGLSLLPLYRRQEGLENMHKNRDTFAACKQLLAKNGGVLVFVEGISVQEKRLRPLKRGAARIALEALDELGLEEVHVVPVAVNYDNPNWPNNRVMLSVAPAISAADFLNDYRAQPRPAMERLTKVIAEALDERIIQLPQPPLEQPMETALTLFRHTHTALPNQWRTVSCDWINEEKAATKTIGKKLIANPDLVPSLNGYATVLKQAKLADHYWQQRVAWWTWLPGLIFSPLYAVLNLPRVVARTIANRTVTLPEFYSSIYFSVSAMIYVLLGLGLYITALVMSGWQGVLFMALVQTGIRMFLVDYRVWWAKWMLQVRIGRTPATLRTRLLSLRKELTTQLFGD